MGVLFYKPNHFVPKNGELPVKSTHLDSKKMDSILGSVHISSSTIRGEPTCLSLAAIISSEILKYADSPPQLSRSGTTPLSLGGDGVFVVHSRPVLLSCCK